MRLLILGDSHGHLDIVHRACREAAGRFNVHAAVQVGDFGLFPNILHRFFHEGPRRFPIPLHVIDGNHEDHRWLHGQRALGTIASWEAANLYIHQRGDVLTLDGVRFGFLGGALHADRRQEWAGQWAPRRAASAPRVPRRPDWANWVTEGDVELALVQFGASQLDVLITHSCPAGIGIGIVGSPDLVPDVGRFIVKAGHWSGPFTDCGEGGLTRLWRELPRRPTVWLFGHFHQLVERTVDQTTFICVGSTDDSDGVRGVRPVIYDTTQRTYTIHSGLQLAATSGS